MKKTFFKTLFFILLFSSVAFAQQNKTTKDDTFQSNPLFQLSGGVVYSSIDLSRYINSVAYRGFHGRIVTHMGRSFFLSTEYSAFPVHESPPAWDNVKAGKFDINGNFSFAANNSFTRIIVLAGINRHAWTARRTRFTDLDQLAYGLTEGTSVKVKRWGVNFGCGFTQSLYENMGLFGDFRFCFANANDFEKVRIMDVMTTLGINFSIPHPVKSNGKKKFGMGKKLYKWTERGAK